MVLFYFRFFLPHVPNSPIYLLEGIFITSIIISSICHRVTLEIVVNWLQRLPCREFAEFLTSYSVFNMYLAISVAIHGSHLHASYFKRSFSFLPSLLESKKKKDSDFSGLWISDFFVSKNREIKSLVQASLPKCLSILRTTGAYILEAIFELHMRYSYLLNFILWIRMLFILLDAEP